jgi:alpha-L-fucosidase
VKSGSFQGNSVSKLGAKDIRFTRNKANTVIYAIVLGRPENEAVIQALGTASPQAPGKVANVELLGYQDKLKFRQDASGLHVRLPAQKLSEDAIALKVSLA